MRNEKENVIVAKTIDFSHSIIRYREVLEQGLKYVIARQPLRAGASIGTNVFEARNAESRADFIHEMR